MEGVTSVNVVTSKQVVTQYLNKVRDNDVDTNPLYSLHFE